MPFQRTDPTILAALACALFLAAGACLAADDAEQPQLTAAMSAWEWCHEVALPEAGTSPWIDFILPPAVFDEARENLGDLRLLDGEGREVPYVLRVGSARRQQRPLASKEIARERKDDRSLEVRLDLGEKAGEHQEIEVFTRGDTFSRRVELQTSDDGQDWTPVVGGQRWLNRYQVENQTTDEYRLKYPPTRKRYLEVRVFPDGSRRSDAPLISQLTVYCMVEVPGESFTLPAALGERKAVETSDGAGSAWTIDLGGERMPCERLLFDVADEVFARAYYVERVDPGKEPVRIARGQWHRSLLDTGPVEIRFAERTVRYLRLVLLDEGDVPLRITAVRFSGPARQVVFARDGELAAPLRLYVGNPEAEPPAYELADRLPAIIEPAPDRAALGAKMRNPGFGEAEEATSEDWQWAIYAAAGAGGVLLLLLLVLLVRRPTDRGRPVRRRR
jgi:hypothetical protein